MPGISSPTPKTRPLSFGTSDAFPAEKAWKHHARLPHSKTGTIGGSRCPRKVRVRVKLRSGDGKLGEHLGTGMAWNGFGGFVCCLGILEPFPQSFLLDFLFGEGVPRLEGTQNQPT